MNQTVDITIAADTCSSAYNQARELLDRLGWNVTYWHAEQMIARKPVKVYTLTLEVTIQR